MVCSVVVYIPDNFKQYLIFLTAADTKSAFS